MMITQGSTQNDLQGLSALLEVISSPDKAKKRLTELLSASKQAQEDEQAAMDAEVKAQKIVDAAVAVEKKQDKREQELNEMDVNIQNDAIDLKGDKVEFTRRVAEFEVSSKQQTLVLAAKVKEFNDYASDMSTRLSVREKTVAQKEATAEKLVAEYTQKLASLKQLVI